MGNVCSSLLILALTVEDQVDCLVRLNGEFILWRCCGSCRRKHRQPTNASRSQELVQGENSLLEIRDVGCSVASECRTDMEEK